MGKLSYYLKVGQCVTFTCQKTAAAEGAEWWLQGWARRALYKQASSEGGAFAEIPFVSDEQAERLVYN